MPSQLAPLPTPGQFYIELPLYEEVTFPPEETERGWLVKYSDAALDAFCSECGAHSVFNRVLQSINLTKDAWLYDPLFEVKFLCSRNKKHSLYFLFKVEGRTMQKIGQCPSLAALNLYDIKKYRSTLDKNTFQELTKAIGLAAHGVGVGSFVYLRRIFEGLVEEAHMSASTDAGWDDTTYLKARMDDKIKLLSRLLPVFLVENRSVYGILSKGIHELSEKECLKAFPVVKIAIEIILDAKLEKEEREKKLAAAKKSIQDLANLNTKPAEQ
jgi:hypothetical protein